MGESTTVVDAAPVTVGESAGVVCHASAWAKTGDFWAVKSDVTKRVKERFDAEGISIPFPQRDVHLFKEDA